MPASPERRRTAPSCVDRMANVPPADVWAVLADGWLYPLWVVGAARARDVDPGWPAVGQRLHHSFGLWPVLTDDTTEVTGMEEPRWLQLRARAWPLGEARIDLTLEPSGPDRTRIRLCETAVAGPGSWVPSPVEAPLVGWRNREALRRLALLAEGRQGGRPADISSATARSDR